MRLAGVTVRGWGLLGAAGVVAATGSLAGFLGDHWWVFDLASHFRVQCVIGLGALALALAWGRQWRAFAVVGVALVINLALVLPYYLARKDAVPSGEPTVRLLLTNVNTANEQFAKVRDYVRAAQPDLVVVEEMDERWRAALAGLEETYPHRLGQTREDNFGIMLFSKLPLLEPAVVNLGALDTPSIRAQFRLAGQTISLIATHPVPPRGKWGVFYRNQQLDAVAAALRAVPGPKILIGDLNMSPWSPRFRHLTKTAGLRDSALGWGVRPTWPTMSVLLRVPIDHCLVSPELAVVKHEAGPDLGSDHFPVLVTLACRRLGCSLNSCSRL